ncbi:YcxB family protein [Aliikangiella sp. IMCC44359]|uniref:YcxB family protein n=1 Tax=Aliikangiella sp. IMCC44359 TaxID=3459125 RepID=UPI00403B0D60
MNQPFCQSTTFTLDKAHFQECFEQSSQPVQNKDYRKAAIIGAIGIALMFIEAEHYYIPFFLIGLAILEVFSVLYRQTWWVWRQLMGKSGYSQIKLIIDEKGITTESEHVNTQIFWSDVKAVEKTSKGLLVVHEGGKNYLSNSHLNEEIIEFILKHNK